ncbi:uncharacterized protein CEXT_655161 [Caerostris extrusa]|uniref:Uncharacterized protein n=1 Tax=Caerostris extrusa TaxID=172846 RepID=A0AAV4QWV0_CAEEX|nr:uncharacterized protein CEXT_655161 [Caerostris extrusa]
MPTLRHSNSVSDWNAELQHFKYKLPRLFLVFLRWAGFVDESDRNCKKQIDLDFLLCSSVGSTYLVPSFLTLLYCSLCFRCSEFVNNLTNEIEKFSPQEFGPCVQFDILKRKSKVDDILEDLENLFSKPSLFLIMLNFVTCVYHLGIILIVPWGYRHMLIVSLFYSVVHFICVTAVFWCAGSVPVALHKLNRIFYKKAHSRLLLVRTSEGRKLKRELFEKPEFALTGCDVIVYKRSTILAFEGVLKWLAEIYSYHYYARVQNPRANRESSLMIKWILGKEVESQDEKQRKQSPPKWKEKTAYLCLRCHNLFYFGLHSKSCDEWAKRRRVLNGLLLGKV